MAKLGYIKGNIYTYLGDGTMEVDLGKGRFGSFARTNHQMGKV